MTKGIQCPTCESHRDKNVSSVEIIMFAVYGLVFMNYTTTVLKMTLLIGFTCNDFACYDFTYNDFTYNDFTYNDFSHNDNTYNILYEWHYL